MKDLLKNIRTELNLTQKEFAEKLGLKQARYSHYENGRRLLPLNIYLLLEKIIKENNLNHILTNETLTNKAV